MNLEQFETGCSEWLGQKETSAEVFSKLVAESLEVFGAFQRDLATEFEVAVSTISRWAKGVASPHPRLQKQVVKYLLARAKRMSKPRPGRATGNFSVALPLAARGR